MARAGAGLFLAGQFLETLMRLQLATQRESRLFEAEDRRALSERAGERRAVGGTREAIFTDALNAPEIPAEIFGQRAGIAGATFGKGELVDEATGRIMGAPRPGQQREDLFVGEINKARGALPEPSFASTMERLGGTTMGQFSASAPQAQKNTLDVIRGAGGEIPTFLDRVKIPPARDASFLAPEASAEIHQGMVVRDTAKHLQSLADDSAARTTGSQSAAEPFILSGEERDATRRKVEKFGDRISSSMISALRDFRNLVPALESATTQEEVMTALFAGMQRGQLTEDKVAKAMDAAAAEIAADFLVNATDSNAEMLMSLIPPALLPSFRRHLEQLRSPGG